MKARRKLNRRSIDPIVICHMKKIHTISPRFQILNSTPVEVGDSDEKFGTIDHRNSCSNAYDDSGADSLQTRNCHCSKFNNALQG